VATHVDANWVIATGAVFAVSLSAYLSLRAAPSVSASDGESVLGAPSRPAPHLTVPQFAPLAMNWSAPVTGPRSQPPAVTSRATTAAKTPVAARSARLQPPPAKATAHIAIARPQPAPPQPQRRPALQPQRSAPATVSPLALNTRRSPFLSNVIASMPSAPTVGVPTLRPAVDTHAAPPQATAAATHTSLASAPPVQPAPQTAADATGSERARTALPASVTAAAATGSEHPRNALPASATAAAARGGAATAPPSKTPSERARSAAVVPSQQASQQQIYAALKEYERAYAQLDAKAVRAVWPSVDARALEKAFHDLKSQTLVFDRCEIDVARGSEAIAACRGRATYETRAGQQASRSEPREWTFTLQKSDEAWRIVSASAR
jgi:hypothetical protein